MKDLFLSLISDFLADNNFPLSSTVSTGGAITLKGLLGRRVESAQQVLLDEIKRGDRPLEFHSADEAAAITYRYLRAAEEGAARLNLRLLARVIVGSVENGALYADDFLRWADTLAGLKREEIIVLGVVQRQTEIFEDPFPDDGSIARFWQSCWIALLNEHGMQSSESVAYASSLTRTGLVAPNTDSPNGGIAFYGTHLLQELAGMMVVEGILERDKADQVR
ncbi:hypothetical protein [Rhizobiales bacterium]